ncbi:hypothetical protein R3P38DRAFT_2773765 [Favolaschia claudopus]|uniref:Uncharacterized protein n=1 Tax=Favolaschia claudopus TaxID=2862362 RepID=A0AAW0C327_9AGAR
MSILFSFPGRSTGAINKPQFRIHDSKVWLAGSNVFPFRVDPASRQASALVVAVCGGLQCAALLGRSTALAREIAKIRSCRLDRSTFLGWLFAQRYFVETPGVLQVYMRDIRKPAPAYLLPNRRDIDVQVQTRRLTMEGFQQAFKMIYLFEVVSWPLLVNLSDSLNLQKAVVVLAGCKLCRHAVLSDVVGGCWFLRHAPQSERVKMANNIITFARSFHMKPHAL